MTSHNKISDKNTNITLKKALKTSSYLATMAFSAVTLGKGDAANAACTGGATVNCTGTTTGNQSIGSGTSTVNVAPGALVQQSGDTVYIFGTTTINNDGTIRSNGNAVNRGSLVGRGNNAVMTVNNSATGVISTGSAGGSVAVGADDVNDNFLNRITLNNDGQITTSGSGTAVSGAENDDVINNNATGVITGRVFTKNGNDTVTNAGTITATGQRAVDLGGGNNTLTNSGTITSAISNSAQTIAISGAATITNSGTIESSGNSSDTIRFNSIGNQTGNDIVIENQAGGVITNTATNAGSSSIEIANGTIDNIDITNSGTIQVDGTTGLNAIFDDTDVNTIIDNSGTIIGTTQTFGGEDVLENSGTIIRATKGLGVGNGTRNDALFLGDGDDNITNEAGGIIDGNINVAGGDDSFTNSGTIIGLDTLDLAAGNDSIINNSSITANLVLGDGNDTVTLNAGGNIMGDLSGGDGDDSVTSNAMISGDITLGDGNDALTVNVSGASGSVNVGAGDDTITNAGIIESSTNLKQPVFDDAGNLTITNSGTIRYSGSDATDAIRIDGGAEGETVTITNTGTIETTSSNASSNAIQGTFNGTGFGIERALNITNSGTIKGDNASVGIIYSGTGAQSALTVDNQSGGVISASATGDAIRSVGTSADTVTNAGTITGHITLGTGNDAITNSGAITGNISLADGDDTITVASGGTITGTGTTTGILNQGGALTVTNDGAITHNATTAIFSSGGTGDTTITNNGTITVNTAVGAADLIAHTSNGNFTLNNSGALTYNNPAATDAGGTAIDLLNSTGIVTVLNSGTLVADGGQAYAIARGASSSFDVTNSGTITGAIDFSGATGGGTITNTASGVLNQNATATGANTDITLSAFDDVMTNAGAITAGAINFGAGEDTFTNSGTITGNVNLGAGADNYDGSGGTLTGNLNFGAGDDSFTVTANAPIITGAIDGGADTDSFVLDASAGDVNFTAANVTNFEQVTFGGGNVALDNDGTLTFANGIISGDGTELEIAEGTELIVTNAAGLTGDADANNVVVAGTVTGNIALGAGDDSTDNTGTITGTIDLGAGSDSLSNTGTITGAVNFGAGDDRFVITADSGTINGVIDGGDDTDRFVLDASSGDVTFTSAAGVTNFEDIEASGGGITTLDTNSTLTFADGFITGQDSGLTIAEGTTLNITNVNTLNGDNNDNNFTVSGTMNGNSSLLDGDDTVTVTSTGVHNGTISVGNGDDAITNAGTIEAGGTNAFTIFTAANHDGNLAVTNSGTIRLNNSSAIADAISLGSASGTGNLTVTNSGTIETANANGGASGYVIDGFGNNISVTNDGQIIATAGDWFKTWISCRYECPHPAL